MKVVSKLRLLFLTVSLVPLISLFGVIRESLMQYPFFDMAMAIAVSVALLIAFLCPSVAARFLVLKSLEEIHDCCQRAKQGDYTGIILPNQSIWRDNENEIQLLMRDLNWMLHQIQLREKDLKFTVDQLSETKVYLVKQKEALAVSNSRLAELAMSDSLTGLANRRHFFDQLERTLYQKQFCMDAVSLLSLDIDHFKKVNDQYGHQVGDQVLIEFSRLLMADVRQGDLPARMGGEEFAVLLVGTDLKDALCSAGRIRANVEQHAFVDDQGGSIHITCSIGVCSFPNMQTKDIPLLYRLTDQALYAAKGAGRNGVFYMDLAESPHTVRFA